LLIRRQHRHPFFNSAILADAEFITKPHNSALAATRPSGRRLNIANHYARAKATVSAQPEGDEHALRE
jgi:hypothetical protein